MGPGNEDGDEAVSTFPPSATHGEESWQRLVKRLRDMRRGYGGRDYECMDEAADMIERMSGHLERLQEPRSETLLKPDDVSKGWHNGFCTASRMLEQDGPEAVWAKAKAFEETGMADNASGQTIPSATPPIVHGQREQEVYRAALEEIIRDPEADAVAIAHTAITPFTPWVAASPEEEARIDASLGIERKPRG